MFKIILICFLCFFISALVGDIADKSNITGIWTSKPLLMFWGGMIYMSYLKKHDKIKKHMKDCTKENCRYYQKGVEGNCATYYNSNNCCPV